MTISNTTRVAGPYTGNGTATTFPFAFKIFAADELLVVKTSPEGVETTLVLDINYTAALNADQNNNPGGSVTLTSALLSANLLTLTSQIQPLQPVDLTNGGGFYPNIINAALDRLTILVQQLISKMSRAVTFPLSDGPISSPLPTKIQRLGRLLAFDAVDGNPTAGPLIASVDVVTANVGAIDTCAQHISEISGASTAAATATTQAGIASTAAATATTQAGIAATAVIETKPIAYVDFTAQADGDPNPTTDTGQSATFVFPPTGRKPVIFANRLVVNNQAGAGTGALADYYQVDLSTPAKPNPEICRIGAEWTMPAGANDGNGNITIAAWDGYYVGGGSLVPRSWIHLSIVPGTGNTGTAKWYTCDGLDNTHLLNFKSKTFKNPPADGVTKWRVEACLDAEANEAYAMLPDGSVMRVTGEELAAFCTAVGKPVQSFRSLASRVMMCEHFCLTGANTAKFAEFESLYAEIDSPQFKSRSTSPLNAMRRAYALQLLIPPVAVGVTHAPTPFVSVATTTGAANIDSTNGKVTATVGPNGKLVITATLWVEFTATDIYYCRVAGSTGTSYQTAIRGTAGQKILVTHVASFSGLTPGAVVSGTLQHWSGTSGSAACIYGYTGSTYYPALSLVANPA